MSEQPKKYLTSACQGIYSNIYSVNDHTNPPFHKRNSAWHAIVLKQTNKAQVVVGLPFAYTRCAQTAWYANPDVLLRATNRVTS